MSISPTVAFLSEVIGPILMVFFNCFEKLFSHSKNFCRNTLNISRKTFWPKFDLAGGKIYIFMREFSSAESRKNNFGMNLICQMTNKCRMNFLDMNLI